MTDTPLPPPQQRATPAANAVAVPKQSKNVKGSVSVKRGRETLDLPYFSVLGSRVILPPPTPESAWRLLDLDADPFANMSVFKLIEMVASISPEVSKALNDFLRLCNSGYDYKIWRRGTQANDPQKQEDQQARQVISDLLGNLNRLYGSVNVIWNMLFTSAYLRGALFAELVFDSDLRTPVDIATPDAATIRYQLDVDPIRGQVWLPGQYQLGKFVPFDRETILVIPIDRFPGTPYGRPMVAPALFAALMLLGVIHDVRRVIVQQGYPRLDISVQVEEVLAQMPDDVKDDPKKRLEWIDAVLDQVTQGYGELEPDDIYAHLSSIVMNRPVGTVDANSMSGLDAIFNVLERMLVRGLKTMPLMLGITDGVSEANANRQWEIHDATIKTVQHLVEQLIERLFSLALEAQGMDAIPEFRFAQLRASEELRDQQTFQLKQQTWQRAEMMSWASHDEAATAVLGHPASAPVPVAYPGQPATVPAASTSPAEQPGGREELVRVMDRLARLLDDPEMHDLWLEAKAAASVPSLVGGPNGHGRHG